MTRVEQTVYTGKRPGRERGVTANQGSTKITTLTTGVLNVDEIQTVTHDHTGGTFTLTYGAATTSALAWNITAANLEIALEALAGLTAVTVAGAAAGPYTVTFNDGLGPMSLLVADGASLTGGTTITVARGTAGVLAVEGVVLFQNDGTDGTFTVTAGNTSGANIHDITAANLKAALEARSAITTVAVTGAANGPYTITFENPTNGSFTANGASLIKGWQTPNRAS